MKKPSVLESLLDRCGEHQDLVIRKETNGWQLQVQIANRIILCGEREYVLAILLSRPV